MNFTGRLYGVNRDLVTGDTIVSFATKDMNSVLGSVDSMKDIPIDVQAKKHRKKRSLDANAYHWVLCGKIADVIDSDADSVHYDLMVRYGTEEDDDDQGRPIVSVLPHVDLRKLEIYGRLIGEGYVNGKRFLHYLLIKPSRKYDSKEMSKLIKGTVQEAQDLGIETLSPAEIEAMMEALKAREKAKTN